VGIECICVYLRSSAAKRLAQVEIYADFNSFALACPQDQFVTASGIALGAPGVELDLTAGGAAPSGQVFDLGSEAGMIDAEGFVFKPDWVC
jgi:hypothetical protein